MPYAVKQDMIDRFGEVELKQLTDRSGDVDAIDDTVLNRALADADAEIDGYLSGRYALPLASTPLNLNAMACDIARYKLYEDRATEHVRQRYDDAVKYLASVARGTISLSLDANQAAQPEAGGPAIEGEEPVFTRQTLADY